MSYTYAAKRHSSVVHQNPQTAPAAPSLDALRAGAVQPTAEQLGRPVDLPGAIQAKMEAAFGADLSAVRLYESQAVADAGAEAVAQGSRIAFAPGKLDFASSSGQALLGHELSHVVSQARGEVTGSGFLRDAALEARADREGALAAAGESVYSGPVTTALSDASAAPAAGPMQASKSVNKAKKHIGRIQDAENNLADTGISEDDRKRYEKQKASGEKWLHYWEGWINPNKAHQEAIGQGKKYIDWIQDAENNLADTGISEDDRWHYENQNASGEKWLNYWERWIDPNEAHQEAIDQGKKYFDQIWDAKRKLANTGISADDRRRYEMQKASGEKWLDYWKKWIDPTEAFEIFANHVGDGDWKNFMDLELKIRKNEYIPLDPKSSGKTNQKRPLLAFKQAYGLHNAARSEEAFRIQTELRNEFNNGNKYNTKAYTDNLHNKSGHVIPGLLPGRLASLLSGPTGENLDRNEIFQLFQKLMAPHEMSPSRSQEERDAMFDDGVKQLKGIYYTQLKRLRDTYGTVVSQMHPEDILRQVGPNFLWQLGLLQDTLQISDTNKTVGDYFDFEHNPDDQEFRRLNEYYNAVSMSLEAYAHARGNDEKVSPNDNTIQFVNRQVEPHFAIIQELEDQIGGPKMDRKELNEYYKNLRKRIRDRKFQGFLFDPFKNLVNSQR